MNPAISVIIPAYNVSAYIHKAIKSVLDQTLKNIEIIVVDDCSTDNTLSVIQSFQDERIKILVNPENLGVSATRNRAIKIAQGNWIALLDADDWYAENRLEKMLEVTDQKNMDMIADDIYYIRDNQEYPQKTFIQRNGDSFQDLFRIDPVTYINYSLYESKYTSFGFLKPMMKRDFLQRHQLSYREGLTIGEDFYLYLDCILLGAEFFLMSEPFYYYRQRQGSLVSSDQLTAIHQWIPIIDDLLIDQRVLKIPTLPDLLQRNLKILYLYANYYTIKKHLAKGELIEGLRRLLKMPYTAVLFAKHIKRKLSKIFGFI